MPTAENHSQKPTTAKHTAAKNAEKKEHKKKPTSDGDDGTTKTKKDYTKHN